jgi:predicted GIY-YIG superfamily endonuclease
MKRHSRPDKSSKFSRSLSPVYRSYPRIIYVLELSTDAAADPAFAIANPQYVAGMPLCYVGSTSQTAPQRFRDHLVGHNASRFAHQYAIKLRFDLMPEQKPAPRERALQEEKRLARFLRTKGFGVWQH